MIYINDRKLICQVFAGHSVALRQAAMAGPPSGVRQGGLGMTGLPHDVSLKTCSFYWSYTITPFSFSPLPALSWAGNWGGCSARLKVPQVRAIPQDQGRMGNFRFKVLTDSKRTISQHYTESVSD